MTDEEKAEEYATEDLPDGYTKINYVKKQSYLDGLAEGKPKWHDLREDTNDLPPKEYTGSCFSINVFIDTEDNAFYSYRDNVWVRESDGLRISKVIAWTELPKFKE